MTEPAGPAPRKRVRVVLLVLLWAWALVIFMVVDMFWNVDQFRAVRPEAPLYEGMRRAGHEMVGTPYVPPDDPGARVRVPAVVEQPAAPVHVGRPLHRYLPRGPDNAFARHGTWTQWNDPPKATPHGAYREGQRDGEWTWTRPEGGTCEVRHYARGVLDGIVASFYENGRQESEEHYEHGRAAGTWKTWFPDGTLASEAKYVDGVLDGPARQWHADGSPAAEARYEHGRPVGELKVWHANGQLEESGSFADGERDGVWTKCDESGHVTSEVRYVAGRKAG